MEDKVKTKKQKVDTSIVAAAKYEILDSELELEK
jgi:hypothetical protein